jgi:cytochrome P450
MTVLSEANEYDDMFDIEEDAHRSGSGVAGDPYPAWAEVLSRGPVHAGPIAHFTGEESSRGNLFIPGYQYFSVFSFAGVSSGFTRPDDFNSQSHQVSGSFTDTILALDGLQHRQLRDVIQEHFQPAAASSWWREKVIAGLVDELVGSFENEQQVDLNARLFARLPLRTVTEGFGLSHAEGLEFRRGILAAMNYAATPEQREQAMASANKILDRVIHARQQEPQDDVISRLVAASLPQEGGGSRPLTVDEIAGFCRLIVFSGGGTPWKQLGITLFALLNNRDQLEAVMADRSLLPKAILESARWYPNDPVFARMAKRDAELEGTVIPAGSILHLCLGSANRDPARWENPDKFDIFRPVQRSVAFAAGPHSCLGQHVAREEMLGAMNALFDRFPNIRWNPSALAPRLSGSLISRGPGPLHVLLK